MSSVKVWEKDFWFIYILIEKGIKEGEHSGYEQKACCLGQEKVCKKSRFKTTYSFFFKDFNIFKKLDLLSPEWEQRDVLWVDTNIKAHNLRGFVFFST